MRRSTLFLVLALLGASTILGACGTLDVCRKGFDPPPGGSQISEPHG
jgi:hypothetical protein